MASTLQQIVTEIQQNNYVSLIILTAVGYDYLLTFSDEVEYIWNKRWTLVSSLFFLARYFGICFAIISSVCVCITLDRLFDSITSLDEQSPSDSCSALIVLSRWAQCLFISAADLVMILRVWALFNQSRFVLSILLLPYAIEVLTLLVTSFAFSIRYNSYGVVSQLLNYSLCGQQPVSAIYGEIADFAQLALGALMCLFICIRFLGESVQTYRARKQFALSNYMNLLLRESIFYFLVVLTWALTNSLFIFNILTSVWWGVVEVIPICTLVPRFTISLRKLYVRDVQRGHESTQLDTAFGFSSLGYDEVVTSAIMFAETQPGQNVEPPLSEEMAMGGRNIGRAA